MQRGLLHDFLKRETEQLSFTVSEANLATLSSDLSFKLHQLALFSKSIMLKSNRNFIKDEDVHSALKLSFKNFFLVPFNDENEERLSCSQETDNEVIINVTSHSVSSMSSFTNFNIRSESDIVFSKLIKSLLSNNENVFKHSLKLIRNKNDIEDVIFMILSAFIVKIDDYFNEELFLRICTILESIVNNPYILLSENPWRDLCISIVLKLLWSPVHLNQKNLNISNVLKTIISRQYLMSGVIRCMVIDMLLKDLGISHMDSSRHSGSLIGLITLDYVDVETIESLLYQISLLPSLTINSTTMKETVSFLFYIMRVKNLFSSVPYFKLIHLMDIFFCNESIVLFYGKLCPYKMITNECSILQTVCEPLVTTSKIISFETVSREIDILLSGGSIDDLMVTHEDMDDLPPVLFRKSHIQLPISNLVYSTQDIGFKSPLRRSNNIIIKISGVDNATMEESHSDHHQPFISDFHAVFQRRRQFIENRYRLKVKVSDTGRKTRLSEACIMNSLFYML